MISVLINNYNYEQFIGEAIESVLSQDYKDFEIIIVDDGSTDKSKNIIESFNDNRIKTIYKENGGQLSCFNSALEYINGDIVAFLDSDDKYKKDYLKNIAQFYKNNSNCDFLYTNIDYIESDKNPLRGGVKPKVNYFLGKTKFLTLLKNYFVGSATSSISMKTKILKYILPAKNENLWVTRADNILVWGASLADANKYYISKKLVEYRLHSNNNFAGKKITEKELEIYKHNLKLYFKEEYEKIKNVTFNNIYKEAINSPLPFYYYKDILNKYKNKNSFLRFIENIKMKHLENKKDDENLDETSKMDYKNIIV